MVPAGAGDIPACYGNSVRWSCLSSLAPAARGDSCVLNSSVGHEKDFTASEAERSLVPVCAGTVYQCSCGQSLHFLQGFTCDFKGKLVE